MKVLSKILNEVNDVVNNVDENQMDNIVELISKDKRIFIYGEGRSGFVGRCFAMRLMHLGYAVYVVGETITPAINENDIIVAISGSGETSLVLNIAGKARDKGTLVIGVSSKEDSSLIKISSSFLIVPGATKSDKSVKSIQLLSSLFDQSLHIVLDAICLKLSYKDKLDNEEAIKNHVNLE
ncbi:6-phospho-3-hexuloisomerase [Clostridium luticellarii]|jgi:6-phospho-3-hexuloisomerase|uniref:3-hexulose-6-phosphate isomerase n=1 Tax=Clostridium luticellarii TaxID=1691940 RepID=A0A2T0BNN0_9CLOT|nr:6-phospho-3-hexuloisomerase [Clostridium luticellarii]MCI1944403.1 6-phospho-3-hexuloisomerase [Clostridium luticellarii]MCI1969159.1 6-phospho-3-hexuloisomerase [Clostridium luticellarii]MCI1995035.1 6-phospho-3-hexuloisomerase [Clostridium luticellarii]MCI2039526.1 6-phospho-3-hexuloisomerase [Clostridium luticellarii]PRR85484.1 3-hexulose-6-phosphate isomerase [Clostridium luticellarii]